MVNATLLVVRANAGDNAYPQTIKSYQIKMFHKNENPSKEDIAAHKAIVAEANAYADRLHAEMCEDMDQAGISYQPYFFSVRFDDEYNHATGHTILQ